MSGTDPSGDKATGDRDHDIREKEAPPRAELGQLNRTMGLPAALAIGIGTMVGAGIFVFPGLVAEEQGASGIFAFLLAGVLALAVALYTAELATALPVSGGSYTVIERYLGRWAGRIVGLAQWAGLVFASAFYLAAFTDYAADILTRLDLSAPIAMSHSGPVAALLLTVIIALGGRRAGGLQAGIVLTLTAALTLIFVAGLWQISAGAAGQLAPRAFLPDAPLSLVSTAAMIFTAYIGFVQIAAVGGEVRRPERNLPRSLVGSVLVVMTLYLLVYFVSATVLGPGPLADAGDTAVVDAGTAIAGIYGTAAVLGAGLLATLSSANASILSASRTLFALARDGSVPRIFRHTGLGSNSPWVTVLVTGLPSAGLAYFTPRLLAELASLLHLVIYGLICFAVWPARRRATEDLAPAFRVPGPPALAVIAGILCFSLVGFMSPQALLASLIVLGVSSLVLFSYQLLSGRD